MFYVLQTLPGLGGLAAEEALQRLPLTADGHAARVGNVRFVPGRSDLVPIRYEGEPRKLLDLRVSEDVFAVAARAFSVSGDERGLRQIYAAVRNSEMVPTALALWRRTNKVRQRVNTFRVITRAVGGHDYIRRDVGRAVADAVVDGWPGRLRRVDKEEDMEIWASLLQDELVCTIRLSGPEMRRSSERTEQRPAALRPAMAAAMIMLTNPLPGDTFLDPMAGTGTLLIERAAAGPYRALYGGDDNMKAMTALRTNVRSLSGDVFCERWDARSLPLADASVHKVAVNLPFGRQMEAGTDLNALYRGTLTELARVLRPGGRFVALVGDWGLLESARRVTAPRFRLLNRYRVEVLGTPATICQFEYR